MPRPDFRRAFWSGSHRNGFTPGAYPDVCLLSSGGEAAAAHVKRRAVRPAGTGNWLGHTIGTPIVRYRANSVHDQWTAIAICTANARKRRFAASTLVDTMWMED